jgi:hypothetical protein
MTGTSLPTIEVSSDQLGLKMVKNYCIYNRYNESRIIKDNYLYSASWHYNTDTCKGEIVISKYDLSTKILVAITHLNLQQVFSKLTSVDLLDADWSVTTGDELLIEMIAYAQVKYSASGSISNLLYITGSIKLKESDLSIIDISERQVDATLHKGTFISMTFGKAKLKPKSWFTDIHLAAGDIKLRPCPGQLRAFFNVKIPNGRRYVGGFNEGVGTPLWFAINCCNYNYDTFICASLKRDNYYFGWGEKWHENNCTTRLYAVEFHENFSAAELKYVDIHDNFTNVSTCWRYEDYYSLSDFGGLIWVEQSCVSGKPGMILLTFSDKDTTTYKIPLKYIIDDELISANFHHDLSNDVIYFACYGHAKPGFVLGYISLDHDVKTATVNTTDLINIDNSTLSDNNRLIGTYIRPEYFCLYYNYEIGPLIITLLPTQWLHDNIVKSETFSPEIYEFDKNETYEVRRTG